MTEITDDYMRQMMGKTRPFTVVVLKKTASYQPDRTPGGVIWEHGRRNFAMRADGQLAVVLPVLDESEVAGIGIFTTGLEETKALMDADPGVLAGWFSYEVHPSRSFPGDALPG